MRPSKVSVLIHLRPLGWGHLDASFYDVLLFWRVSSNGVAAHGEGTVVKVMFEVGGVVCE